MEDSLGPKQGGPARWIAGPYWRGWMVAVADAVKHTGGIMNFAARCPGLFAFTWLLSLGLLCGCRSPKPERLWAHTRINGQAVRFVYDTGADVSLVFTGPARRLGLHVDKPASGDRPEPGKVLLGSTGLCHFSVGQDTYTLKLATFHLPWPVPWITDIDGLIGWPDMTDDYVAINAAAGVVQSVDSWPPATNGWSQFPIYTGTEVLALRTPRADGKAGVWEVDTGDDGSVSLAPKRWKEWRASHPHAHWRLRASYMPGSGLGLYREYQADELVIGSLTLKDVKVRRANRTQISIAAKGDVLEGCVGIQALNGLDVLINRKDHVAYLRRNPGGAATNFMHRAKGSRVAVAAAQSNVHLDFRVREYDDLAQEAFGKGDFTEARAQAGHWLALRPDDPGALGFRGTMCYLTQQWDDAVKDFHHLGELNPDAAMAVQNLIWAIRARAGETEAASQDLAAALARLKSQAGHDWETNTAAFLLGRLEEVEFLRSYGDNAKYRCEAWYYAAMKRRQAGDMGTAREYFGKCVATKQEDLSVYQFAVAELKM